MKKFEYKGKQWHEECFTCMVCKEPIRNKSFIPRDDQVVCVPCYERDFAQKCSACAGVRTILLSHYFYDFLCILQIVHMIHCHYKEKLSEIVHNSFIQSFLI